MESFARSLALIGIGVAGGYFLFQYKQKKDNEAKTNPEELERELMLRLASKGEAYDKTGLLDSRLESGLDEDFDYSDPKYNRYL